MDKLKADYLKSELYIRDEYMNKLKTLKDDFINSIDENKIDYRPKKYILDNARKIIKKSIIDSVKNERV